MRTRSSLLKQDASSEGCLSVRKKIVKTDLEKFLNLPAAMRYYYEGKRSKTVQIEFQNIKRQVQVTSNSKAICAGWLRFTREVNLQVNDSVIFNIVTPTRILFQIENHQGFPNSPSQNPLEVENNSGLLENEVQNKSDFLEYKVGNHSGSLENESENRLALLENEAESHSVLPENVIWHFRIQDSHLVCRNPAVMVPTAITEIIPLQNLPTRFIKRIPFQICEVEVSCRCEKYWLMDWLICKEHKRSLIKGLQNIFREHKVEEGDLCIMKLTSKCPAKLQAFLYKKSLGTPCCKDYKNLLASPCCKR